MTNTILFKRGLEADLATANPQAGEPVYTSDSNRFFIGNKEFAGLTDGKIAENALPDGAMSDFFEVTNYADLATLIVTEWDQAKVTSENSVYLYDGTNWMNLSVQDGWTF